MRAPLFASTTLASVILGFGVGCSYEPRLVDGTLRCSSSGAECPQGYSCSACGTCWSDQLEGAVGGKLSGNALPQPLLNRYVGAWALSTCANVVTTCDDDFTGTNPLSPDSANPSIMLLDPGSIGSADLVSDWDQLCVLDLSLNAGGAHLYGRDQGCFDDTADPVSTWTARKFDIITTSPTTAILSATYSRLDQFADLTVTNCTQTVHAPMTKR
jgi:hypothetical protein